MLLPLTCSQLLESRGIGQNGIVGSKLPLLQLPRMLVDQRERDQAGKMDDRTGDSK